MIKLLLKYRIFSLGFLILFSFVQSIAQNIDEDLKNISLKYENSSQIFMKKTINYYENYSAKKPLETHEVVLKQSNKQLYTRSFDSESLIVEGLSLIIDHKSKIIILAEDAGDEFTTSLAIDFEGLKKISSKIKYKKVGKRGCYTFYFETGEQVKASIWFDKESLNVEKIVFFMREETSEDKPSRLEMLITEFKSDYSFEPSTFTLEQFIIGSEEGVKPVEKYKDYKVINNVGN
jgi:hypothetical protein